MYNEVTPLACQSEMLNLMSKDYHVKGYLINLMDIGWEFELSNSYTSNGQCNVNGLTGKKVLLLSEWLINNLDRSMDIWKDVMLHEIAHAIDIEIRGCSDHSDVWVKLAQHIGCSGDISTYAEYKQGVHPIFILECTTCGYQELSNEVSNDIKTDNSSCGRCHPKGFNRKYLMTWRPNPDHIHDTSVKSSLYTFGGTKY
jgi:predicted SprT family Zn-dependent metalloprotease|tara:strand:+ start:7964 stop:8560 length:597 start_codon:yes stop_codon:yes gene_type:complete